MSTLNTSNTSSVQPEIQHRSVQTSFTGKVYKTLMNLSPKYELRASLSTHAQKLGYLYFPLKKKRKREFKDATQTVLVHCCSNAQRKQNTTEKTYLYLNSTE